MLRIFFLFPLQNGGRLTINDILGKKNDRKENNCLNDPQIIYCFSKFATKMQASRAEHTVASFSCNSYPDFQFNMNCDLLLKANSKKVLKTDSAQRSSNKCKKYFPKKLLIAR